MFFTKKSPLGNHVMRETLIFFFFVTVSVMFVVILVFGMFLAMMLMIM